MRAWRFHAFGKLENLSMEDIDLPEPGAGEVLLRVERAALNPADRYMVLGQYPKPGPLPFAVGRDASGTVERALSGGRFQRGDRVALLRSDLGVSRTGTLAEYVAVPEESLAPLPDGWSLEEGAAGPLVHLTAYQALVDRGGLLPGEIVLVTGASGGVGSAAVVLASALGARVIALSRSASKREHLLAMGAEWVADPTGGQWEAEIKKMLGRGRVDLVVENLGGPFLQQCVNLLAAEGRIMLVGLLAGLTSELVLGHLIHKCVRIQGLSVSSYTAAASQAAWTRIAGLLETAHRRPLIDSVFPMTSVPEAFARLAEGPMGKVVVDVTA